MAEDNKEDLTTKQEENKGNNPEGKGGFGDNPQNRSNGAWTKIETFRYWYDVFKEMTVTELKEWQEENPENTRKVVADLAFTRVVNAKKDLKEFQEVANRSEGMPKQSVKTTGDTTSKLDEEQLATLVGAVKDLKEGIARKKTNAEKSADQESD